MAENTPNSEFDWDIVVFKVCNTFRRLSIIVYTIPLNYVQVEDRIFSVPRYEFVQSSEVFADMFILPSGPGANTEGQDREHPIVLEGYQKDEFSCLLKVMYPTYVLITFIKLHPTYLCLNIEPDL
jgi:hypothetical protein